MVSKDGGGRSKGEECGADVAIFLAGDLKMFKNNYNFSDLRVLSSTVSAKPLNEASND